ncbi:MAG: DUF5106 domain-containing protein [Muribaculaceae bacterium]|nr:DUF5106 domain-containing protein [Muribaculaceae bacterium]
MKRKGSNIMPIYRFLFFLAVSFAALSARGADGELFKYPEVPNDKVLLSERCNYLVYHFWDKANLTTAFSARQKLSNALNDWFNLMPYATADTVHISLDALITKVSKNPANLRTLAELAEGLVYSDTSEIRSEEIYLPFAQAVATNKKLSKADRARFTRQVQVMESSAIGASVPESVSFTDLEGNKRRLRDVEGMSVLLYFVDPTCSDCTLATVRLAADQHLAELTDAGEMAVVMIYADEPDEQWKAKAATMPARWIKGTMPDADEYFDITTVPTNYLLDDKGTVVSRNVSVDQIMAAAANVNMRKKLSGK